jgi:ATP-dependent Clp protease ATP-binding subunit ClpA
MNIPPETIESLRNLDSHLKTRLKGQDHVISRIVPILQRGELGLMPPNRPKGSFLLLGPTGVGKTETVLAFADYLNLRLFRLDMSEFQHTDQIKNFIGDESGYEGRLGRILVENWSGVLLFDEIEKANYRLWDVFLQMLDAGRVTTGRGTTHLLEGFYLAATSNIGGSEILRLHNLPLSSIERIVFNRLEEEFRPELVARFDEKIVFQKLSGTVLREITSTHLEYEQNRLENLGVQIAPDSSAVDSLIRSAVNRHHGARPIKRATESWVAKSAVKKLLS